MIASPIGPHRIASNRPRRALLRPRGDWALVATTVCGRDAGICQNDRLLVELSPWVAAAHQCPHLTSVPNLISAALARRSDRDETAEDEALPGSDNHST